MAVPDYFKELPAYRKFTPTNGGVALASVGVGGTWTTRDLGEALCTNGVLHQDGCPDFNCSCGFYCYRERADAEQHAQGTILARVSIWGRIVEHTRGYRAQHMRIEEIFVPSDYPAIEALNKRYGVPVTIDKGAMLCAISGNQSVLLSSNLSQSQSFYQNGWGMAATGISVGFSSPNYNPSQFQLQRRAAAIQNALQRQLPPSISSALGPPPPHALGAPPPPAAQPPPHLVAALDKTQTALARTRTMSAVVGVVLGVLIVTGIAIAVASTVTNVPVLQDAVKAHPAATPAIIQPVAYVPVGPPERPTPTPATSNRYLMIVFVTGTRAALYDHYLRDLGTVRKYGDASVWFLSANREPSDVRDNLHRIVGGDDDIFVAELNKHNGAAQWGDSKFWKWITEQW